MIPNTECFVQVFPTKLIFSSLQESSFCATITLRVQGPVCAFTVQLDAEACILCVWGEAQDGYFKYRIRCCGERLALQNERRTLVLSHEGRDVTLARSAEYLISIPCKGEQIPIPRLSLGVHKAQEWEKIRTRADIREFFPIWHRLGHCFPPSLHQRDVGTLRLLARCREFVYANKKEQIIEAFTELFLAAMGAAFVPRICDWEFQGILPEEEIDETCSPLPILSEGARLIEALFFREEQGEISLLPCTPSRIHCGRLIDRFTQAGDLFALEWTKHKLRRVHVASHSGQKILLRFPKPLKRCRMRTSHRERGQLLFMDHQSVIIPPVTCMLDRFE
jgi:hypothetical protein